jgi:2,4-dienoyl-CoA reductase-like NADH-dependent reductase (Old Yellow Enzyme family)
LPGAEFSIKSARKQQSSIRLAAKGKFEPKLDVVLRCREFSWMEMKAGNFVVEIQMQQRGMLFEPLKLPCGATLKNRIAKSAMSDSLGDGTGHPTVEQIRLYQRWAEGGLAVSIIGEVQGNADYAEKPGNLVLNQASDLDRFRELAQQGGENGTQLWLQLGHAGALAYAPTSTPKARALSIYRVCAARN